MTTYDWSNNRHVGMQREVYSDVVFKEYIRDIKDFPKKGVDFKDITPLLQNGAVFSKAIEQMAYRFSKEDIDIIVCTEARGFLIGSALANSLRCGIVPCRKPNKLPFTTIKQEYDLEYGKDVIEMHLDAVLPAQRVLVVDDVLATGGTAKATIDLVKQLGGKIIAAAFLVELAELGGRNRLDVPVYSLIRYGDYPLTSEVKG